MKGHQQLRDEAGALLERIEAEELVCWRALSRLKVLKDRAYKLRERVNKEVADLSMEEGLDALRGEFRRSM